MATNGTSADASGVAKLLQFEHLCGALRKGLGEAMALKVDSDKGAAAFLALQSSAMGLLELKEVNRGIWEKVSEAKADTQSKSGDMDQADLKLQNLQYEKNYFLREIRLARDYPPDKPFELLSPEEFQREAPPEKRGCCG